MIYMYLHIDLKTPLLAMCFFLFGTQLNAQATKSAPTTDILLEEVDAKLSLPDDNWKKREVTAQPEDWNLKSVTYSKTSNGSEMSLIINVIERKTDAVAGLLKEFNKLLGADEHDEEADLIKQMLGVNFDIKDLTSPTQPIVKDFKNATLLALKSVDNPESGYFVAIKKENTVAQVLLLSSGTEHQKNLPELMAIVKSISQIKNLRTQDADITFKNGVKLPATVLCEYFPVCDGYSYTYVETDPILGKVKHTKLYEKVADKTVNGKKFSGFLVHCTNPFLDGRYEYYNFENGALSIHQENEEFTTNSYEEYNVFNPAERRTSYETQLVGNNSFTTSILLKTNIPEGSFWAGKAVNSGYVSTVKYAILEKGVTVRAGANSYPNVIVVSQDIHTDIVATGAKVNLNVKMYFAKGVGLIKTVVVKDHGDLTEKTLETFTFQ